MKNRKLRCYAECVDGTWEAGCVDLDIFVEADTFNDVYNSLNKAIKMYLETVSTMPAADQRRLLNRKAPISVRLDMMLRHILCFFFRAGNAGERHDFTSNGLCQV